MLKTHTAKFEALYEDFGLEGSIEILEFALPFIIKRERKIKVALLSGKWGKASKHAHKTMSSAPLYSSDKLLDLLSQVKKINDSLLDATTLQLALSKEFNVVINDIKDYLAEYSDN